MAQEAFIKAYRALLIPRRERLLHLVVSHRHQYGEKLAGLPGTPSQRANAIETEDGETFNETENLTDISTPESMVASREIAQTVNAAIEHSPRNCAPQSSCVKSKV